LEASGNQGGTLQQERLPREGRTNGDALTIVEDSLSAIKVARVQDAIPLFGSYVDNEKLATIVSGYRYVNVWLDADKFPMAQSITVRCTMLGKDARVIYTELDPKYCNAQDYL
jgi:hypothetical protein